MVKAETSIRISVKLIATYRKLLPEGFTGRTLQLELEPDTLAADLMSQLGVPLDASSVVLVNGHVLKEGQVLQEGDEVTAFPALAGGTQNNK